MCLLSFSEKTACCFDNTANYRRFCAKNNNKTLNSHLFYGKILFLLLTVIVENRYNLYIQVQTGS